jgi:hypothetical protein
LMLWPFLGCSLQTAGIPALDAGADAGAEAGALCSPQVPCDDANPCTADACEEGACVHPSLPDGDSLEQVAGDCLKLTCMAGARTTVTDTTDVASDDNDCTVDACEQGGTAHTQKANGEPCELAGETGACSAGDCQLACQCTPDTYCSVTTCVSKKRLGEACSGSNQCLSAHCVDGVCCGATSCGVCQSCNVSSPTAGTCSNIPNGMPDAVPAGTCATQCDGTGRCKRGNGQPCSLNTECLSGSCADGVCCSTGCSEVCKACNLAGSVGTCSFKSQGATDAPLCGGSADPTRVCNGTGACLVKNGQSCSKNSDCLSGKCLGNGNCK